MKTDADGTKYLDSFGRGLALRIESDLFAFTDLLNQRFLELDPSLAEDVLQFGNEMFNFQFLAAEFDGYWKILSSPTRRVPSGKG